MLLIPTHKVLLCRPRGVQRGRDAPTLQAVGGCVGDGTGAACDDLVEGRLQGVDAEHKHGGVCVGERPFPFARTDKI